MSWIRSERLEFINEYERKYGVRLLENDEMLPIIHFIFDAGKSTDSRLSETKQLIAKLEQTVTQSAEMINPKTYHFSPGEALKWQVGIGIKILMIIAGFLIVSWSCYFYWSSHSDLKTSQQILASAPMIEKNLLQNIQKDNRGYYFLEFKKPTGDSVHFFDEYDLMSNGAARVYLAKN